MVPFHTLRGLMLALFSLPAIAAQAFEGEHALPQDDPNAPAWVTSAASGNWSDPQSWSTGEVPAAGSRVHIQAGHTITYDLASESPIRAIFAAGTLTFAADKDTLLVVGVIKIEPASVPNELGFDCGSHTEEATDAQHAANAQLPGQSTAALPTQKAGFGMVPGQAALLVGTPDAPIDREHRATIRLAPIAGQDPKSCPAIVCCGGRMDFHGAPLDRTWVKLAVTAEKGATEVMTGWPSANDGPLNDWRPGDRLIITDTAFHDFEQGGTEARFLTQVDGTRLVLDQPLEFRHLGEAEFHGEVANLSRNVVVESAEPDGQRGHTMYHAHSAGSISYAEFRHLGKKDVLGRYSLHFHLVGNSMRGSYVQGASIWDSHNRWLTIHGTNYLVVRDCVGYRSIGHGYFLEDGTEVFNVLDHNLAANAENGNKLPEQVLPFDQNDGAGFWWANSLNSFTRNVAVSCGQYGFRFESTETSLLKLELPIMQPDGSTQLQDIRRLPFVRFEDNEVHSSRGLYGFNLGEGVNGVGPDARHPFVVKNTTIWNVHYGFRPQVPSLLVDNMLIQSGYGIYHPNFDHHVYRDIVIRHTNTEPFNRGHDDDSRQVGPLTVDGLTFDGCRSGGMPLVQISDDNPTGLAVSHLRGLHVINWTDNSSDRAIVNLGGGPRPQPKTAKGVPIFVHDWFGPGRDAQVVSTRSPEFNASPGSFQKVESLTGDESRAAEIANVEFPELLTPVDDLPPVTVITKVERKNDVWHVFGTASDNGTITEVTVNGKQARALGTNFNEWVVQIASAGTVCNTGAAQDSHGLPAEMEFVSQAVDAAGNVEKLPHRIPLDP